MGLALLDYAIAKDKAGEAEGDNKTFSRHALSMERALRLMMRMRSHPI